MGTYTCSIARKLDMENAPDMDSQTIAERRRTNEWVQAKFGKAPQSERVPILYAFELYRSEAVDEISLGHMVWTDLTLTRFHLVFFWPDPQCEHKRARDLATTLTRQTQTTPPSPRRTRSASSTWRRTCARARISSRRDGPFHD